MKSEYSGKKIFFYCVSPTLRGNGDYLSAYHYYQHETVCLGEGLKELGIEFYANINFWKLYPDREEYLFQHNPNVIPNDCDVVVCNHLFNYDLPENLFQRNRKYITVHLDASDDDLCVFGNQFSNFNFILKTHCSHKSWYPTNFHPWAFGLSSRILQTLDSFSFPKQREKQMLVNYRESLHSHTVRNFVRRQFFPKIQPILPIYEAIYDDKTSLSSYDLLQRAHSGGRHYPNYYQRLKESQACAAFGGFFTSPLPRNQSSFLSCNLRRIITKLGIKSSRILQWDSWRFWESLAAGCVAFHVDFDKYDFVLPIMPENWKHYIGVDLDNPQATIDRIANNPSLLEEIAIAGKNWATKHYSPVPTALRFLETVCS